MLLQKTYKTASKSIQLCLKWNWCICFLGNMAKWGYLATHTCCRVLKSTTHVCPRSEVEEMRENTPFDLERWPLAPLWILLYMSVCVCVRLWCLSVCGLHTGCRNFLCARVGREHLSHELLLLFSVVVLQVVSQHDVSRLLYGHHLTEHLQLQTHNKTRESGDDHETILHRLCFQFHYNNRNLNK